MENTEDPGVSYSLVYDNLHMLRLTPTSSWLFLDLQQDMMMFGLLHTQNQVRIETQRSHFVVFFWFIFNAESYCTSGIPLVGIG